MKLEDWQKQERFIPLTYLEAIKGKPLVIKLNDEWNFVTCPQTAINFVSIIDRKDLILTGFERLKAMPVESEDQRVKRQLAMIGVLRGLVELLYDISKDEYETEEKENSKEKTKQQLYYAFLTDYFINNIDALFDVWEKVLEYNARLEKKNEVPDELRSSSRPRPVDKWRGFLYGRNDITTKAFLTILHEDEEDTCRTIRQHNTQKEHDKKNKRSNDLATRFGR